MRKLGTFIFIWTLLGSLIMFSAVYMIMSAVYESVILKEAEDTSKLLADNVFDSLSQVMSTKENKIREVVEKSKAQLEKRGYYIEVYRSEIVENLFGKINDMQFDRYAQMTLSDGKERKLKTGSMLKYLYPLKAKDNCLRCHTNAAAEDVLGTVEVKFDISSTIQHMKSKSIQMLFFISSIPLLGALTIAYTIRKKTYHAVNRIHQKIENINSVSDLSGLHINDTSNGFDEINAVIQELNRLIQKLKNISIDKDILKLEINLVEKLVISSDTIPDWQEYTKNVLMEINKIIRTQFIFTIFTDDDMDLTVQTFWINHPGEKMLGIFDEAMSCRIKERFRDFTGSLTVNHFAAVDFSAAQRTEKIDIQLQVKTVLMESPKVGGIIGIGMHSEFVGNPAMPETVINNFLTNLINVIGSVKALAVYTNELEHLATRDPLTNLFNRRAMWEMMENETAMAKRHGFKFSILMIDIDNFRAVNDFYGHFFGDKLLSAFADYLKRMLRDEDIISRYGSDEFIVIIPLSDENHSVASAERILNGLKLFAVETPDKFSISASASIGISVFPEHADNPKDIFIMADKMVSKAKSMGKNRICLSDKESVIKYKETQSMQLIKAVEEKNIIPYFQPILNVKTESIEAQEVLMRIKAADGRIMPACEFIEIAEGMGITSKMDLMLIGEALEQVTRSNYEGIIFFNLSPKSLLIHGFVQEVYRIVSRFKIKPCQLVFEITERDTIKNIEIFGKFLSELKEKGFNFAIDDFGSGFSSLQYVKKFPVDYIKIEGDFIRGMVSDKSIDRTIVCNISTLAKEVNLKSIAEFVENEDTLNAVISAGINYAQGYHIGKPSPEIKKFR